MKVRIQLENGNWINGEFKGRTADMLPDVVGQIHYKLMGIDMKSTIYSDSKKNKIKWEPKN